MADANHPPPQSTEADGLTDDEYDAILAEAELYFETCLQIRTKDEGLQPLTLNTTQRIVHDTAEQQLAEDGRVRLLVLKGRQVGVSTYIGGRAYRKVTTNQGQLAYIVTHEDQATQNLFGMAKRFHEHCLPDFKPPASTNNANELAFGEMDSAYKIATAGARTAGRSSTIQFLHISEFDFWPDATADEVYTGLMEAVAKGEGTEVFIESTANVPGGRFHRAWKAAKRGESSFRALFIPWFLHTEYRAAIPQGWEPPSAFREYGQLYSLDAEQIRWAWETNRDAGMTFGLTPDEFCPKFKREYPATDDEAFEHAGDDLARVFPIEWIRKAQARWMANRGLPLKPMTGLGVDIAQGGSNKTALSPLHEVRFEAFHAIPGHLTPDGPAVAAATVQHVRDGATIALDFTGGWGGDAYTHLKTHLEMPVLAVVFSEGSSAKTRDGKLHFRHMRDELHWKLREGLDPINGDNIELPPDDELVEEMLALTFEVKPGVGIVVLPKDEVKKKIGRSPDKLDSAILAWRAGDRNSRAQAAASRIRRRQQMAGRETIRHHQKVVGRR